MKVLPGDKLNIKIVAKGESREQGVGYSDEGVQIVVEHVAHLIGKNVEVTVTKLYQTATGQVIFAKKA